MKVLLNFIIIEVCNIHTHAFSKESFRSLKCPSAMKEFYRREMYKKPFETFVCLKVFCLESMLLLLLVLYLFLNKRENM